MGVVSGRCYSFIFEHLSYCSVQVLVHDQTTFSGGDLPTVTTTHPPTNPPVFYTVNNVLDPDALDTTALREAEYRFWKRQTDGLDPDRDCDALASSLTRVTGKPRRYNYNALNALLTLAELPPCRRSRRSCSTWTCTACRPSTGPWHRPTATTSRRSTHS